MVHELDGKYIIYKYGYQDYEDEGWALALYRLLGDGLVQIYHPQDSPDVELNLCSIGRKEEIELLEYMVQKGIREVWSVFHLEDFFGIPHGFQSHHEPGEEPEVIELWYEYKSLNRDSQEHKLLIENGIMVHFYDNTKRGK